MTGFQIGQASLRFGQRTGLAGIFFLPLVFLSLFTKLTFSIYISLFAKLFFDEHGGDLS